MSGTIAECDVIVVGAGIAGLTAAATASSLGLRAVVLERLGPGGQLLNTTIVESELDSLDRRSAPELAALAAERAMDAGATLEFVEATTLEPGRRHVVETESGRYGGTAVILAMGGQPIRLGIPGELEFAGRGVSYCVACDGPLFHRESVVVLAGGNYAAKEAHELCELAAYVAVVTIDEGSWAKSFESVGNAQVVRDSRPVAIEGDTQGVSGVRLAAGDRDWQVDARGVFICAGYAPVSELVSKLVELDADGRIVTNDSLETSVRGVYAVGDVRSGSLLTLRSAEADGVTAATAIADGLRRGATN